MKYFFCTLLYLSGSSICFCQSKPAIKKSWIKWSSENLTGAQNTPDTLYTRYTFNSQEVIISFYPGWDEEHVFAWQRNNSILTIGSGGLATDYTIEELTDSSLIIAAKGFRRIKFMAEDYLSSKEEYLHSIGEFNGKPLYEANWYITPRYKKGVSLSKELNNIHDYSRKAYFKAIFIVDEEGKVQNVQVVSSITKAIDDDLVEYIKKTSKRWRPAMFKGKPVQTQIFYDLRILDSIVPQGLKKMS